MSREKPLKLLWIGSVKGNATWKSRWSSVSQVSSAGTCCYVHRNQSLCIRDGTEPSLTATSTFTDTAPEPVLRWSLWVPRPYNPRRGRAARDVPLMSSSVRVWNQSQRPGCKFRDFPLSYLLSVLCVFSCLVLLLLSVLSFFCYNGPFSWCCFSRKLKYSSFVIQAAHCSENL